MASIKRVEIEPADDGGFVVTVQKKEPARTGKGNQMAIPSYDSLRSTHVCANKKQISGLLDKLFSDQSSSGNKGKESSVASGSTRSDSYEYSEE